MAAWIETKGQIDHHRQVAEFARRRHELRENGGLSLPSELGKLAIIVAGATKKRMPGISPSKQFLAFMEEGDRVKEQRERSKNHKEVVLMKNPGISEMLASFADPEVSDHVLIGHGAISRIWLKEPGSSRQDVNWSMVAQATLYGEQPHLKQGKVEQMMCGHIPSMEFHAVPLGTFAVNSLSNVIAAEGQVIPMPGERDESIREELFQPVFTGPDSNPDDVISQLNELNARR